jgi:GNAT superfamily N-acetyltransferase
MAEGKTYSFPEDQTQEQARPWWMEPPPGQTVVAVSEGTITGSAKMGPNRPGRGSHVATASFLVYPARQGQGTGRALGEYVLDWCRSAGFASIQFNAVVETNTPAVRLWQSLGFTIIGTAPAAFDHPNTAGSACILCTATCDRACPATGAHPARSVRPECESSRCESRTQVGIMRAWVVAMPDRCGPTKRCLIRHRNLQVRP